MSKSKVVINGFDPEDIAVSNFNDYVDYNDKKIHIAYTGRIYQGKSDGNIFFRLLRELADENQILLDDIQIDYAGHNFDLFMDQAKKYDLCTIMKNCGLVPREYALSLQRNADILLALSWNDEDGEDVLTGKFMEYLMAKKPILAIVNGNKKDCKIKEIISNSKAGFCYEQANDKYDADSLRKFFLECYRDYKYEGKIKYNGNFTYLEKYSYKNIAAKYQEIIEDATIE